MHNNTFIVLSPNVIFAFKFLFNLLSFYLKAERQKQSKRYSIYWFTPHMPETAGASPGESAAGASPGESAGASLGDEKVSVSPMWEFHGAYSRTFSLVKKK